MSGQMLRYPFRGEVRGWLLLLVLASVITQYFTGAMRFRWVPRFSAWTTPDALALGVIGMIVEVYWWLVAFKIAVQGLRAGAKGSGKHATRDDWIDDDSALRQVVLWGGLFVAAYAIYLQFGGGVLAFCAPVLALALPAILLLLGTEDSLMVALDPRAWRPLLMRTGGDYFLVVAKLSVLVLLIGLVHVKLIPAEPRWLHVPLVRLAWLFALFAGYYELGRLLDRNPRAQRQPEPAEPAAPAELTEAEELAMRSAERYFGEQRYSRAVRELEYLVARKGTSAKLHWRYRELCALGREEGKLLVHGRIYVEELLGLGEEQQALALYEDCLTFSPAFELTVPARALQLFEVLVRERKEDMAIEVARQFLDRFPEDPEGVSAGLGAARLLDRQGHEEPARRLLVDLVRRFPAHPLRAELVAALETLEGAARRGGPAPGRG